MSAQTPTCFGTSFGIGMTGGSPICDQFVNWHLGSKPEPPVSGSGIVPGYLGTLAYMQLGHRDPEKTSQWDFGLAGRRRHQILTRESANRPPAHFEFFPSAGGSFDITL